MNRDSVYTPAEDTFLLANEAQRYTANSALEMGVGSGYLTAELAKQAEHVIGTDINPEAIKQTRERLEIEGLERKVELVCCSAANAFSDCSFDLVVFNPPYLPSFAKEDIAIEGGMGGIEVALQMLEQGSRTLRTGGTMLFAISSQSNYGRLLSFLPAEKFNSKIIAKRKLFFEEILVVRTIRTH